MNGDAAAKTPTSEGVAGLHRRARFGIQFLAVWLGTSATFSVLFSISYSLVDHFMPVLAMAAMLSLLPALSVTAAMRMWRKVRPTPVFAIATVFAVSTGLTGGTMVLLSWGSQLSDWFVTVILAGVMAGATAWFLTHHAEVALGVGVSTFLVLLVGSIPIMVISESVGWPTLGAILALLASAFAGAAGFQLTERQARTGLRNGGS